MQNYWTFHRTLLDNEVQSSDDATKIIKIPLTGFLHGLYLKCKITNGATSTKNQSLSDVVDRIEVIANGSDVLYSLTPQEIKRWSLWETGLNIPQYRSEVPAAVQEATYPIKFGRYPYDPNYYLPCARLSDLELRVRYSPTIAATAFATGSFTLTLMGLMSMGAEPGQYQGTLSHKTIKSFTTGASGDEQVLFPRGNLLRQALIYCYEAGIEDGVDITRIRFDVNNGERQMYDIAWRDLQDWNGYDNWIQHVENILTLTVNADVIDTKVARIQTVNMSENFAGDATGDEFFFRRPVTVAGDRVTVEGFESDTTAGSEDLVADATLRKAFMHVEGDVMSHAVMLDFTRGGEGNIINTNEFDTLRATLTQGAAGGDCRVSTQEVRSL